MKLIDLILAIVFLLIGCWDFGSAFIYFSKGRYRLAGVLFGAAVYVVVYAVFKLFER